MIQRMIGAARLNVGTFEEIESDRGATLQALLVVVIVALADGIGALLAVGESAAGGFLGGMLRSIIGWAVWAGVTFLVGTTLLRTPETRADWGQLARTTGFAQSPGVLFVFGFVPVVGRLLVVVVMVWQFIAMVLGVRQALDYSSTLRAIGVVVIGFIPYVVVVLVIDAILGIGTLTPTGTA